MYTEAVDTTINPPVTHEKDVVCDTLPSPNQPPRYNSKDLASNYLAKRNGQANCDVRKPNPPLPKPFTPKPSKYGWGNNHLARARS